MIVEILGVGFTNKGAELMLAAILDRMRTPAWSDALPAVSAGTGNYARRARYGLLQVMDLRRSGRLGWLIERLLHAGYRHRFGLVARDEVSIILDASGFAIGDVWPAPSIEARAALYAQCRARGGKVVLLPQAFGPFEKPEVRAASTRALMAADLVLARDTASFEHASSLVPTHRGLGQAGDFTNLLRGSAPSGRQLGSRPVAIVPNAMLLRHADSASTAYLPFLVEMIRHVRHRDLDPFILVHESANDRALAAELAAAAGGVAVIDEPDPIATKGIAGACLLTIGSRFHGLVNALSQGVPSVATSWSHKYQALFADYGRPDWLVDPASDKDRALTLIDRIIADHAAERHHLLAASGRLRDGTDAMWREVETLIAGQTRVAA